jgi:hypothetical protein
MYQKDLIRSLWNAAGLYGENDAKLLQFLNLLEDPTQCWASMIDTCRRSYAAYKTKVAQPILASSDKLVHLAVIRAVSTSENDEVELLEQYIKQSDPVRDETELKAIALKSVDALNVALKGKVNLTPAVAAMLGKGRSQRRKR